MKYVVVLLSIVILGGCTGVSRSIPSDIPIDNLSMFESEIHGVFVDECNYVVGHCHVVYVIESSDVFGIRNFVEHLVNDYGVYPIVTERGSDVWYDYKLPMKQVTVHLVQDGFRRYLVLTHIGLRED